MPARYLKRFCFAVLSAGALISCGGGSNPTSTNVATVANASAGASVRSPISLVTSSLDRPSQAAATHAITFDPEAFFALRVNDVFQLTLPGSGVLNIKVESRTEDFGDGVSMIGYSTDPLKATVLLSGRGKAISGSIALGDVEWKIRSTSGKATIQNDKAAGIAESQSHDESEYLKYIDSLPKAPVPKERAKSLETPRAASAGNVSVIDLGFTSDQSYRSAMGGVDYELADLANVIAYANKALADSGAFVKFRMVGYWPVNANWSTKTVQTIKSEISADGGLLGQLGPQRVSAGVDVMVAVTAWNDAKVGASGIADLGLFFGPQFSSAGGYVNAVITRGYRSSDRTVSADFVLAHELGHIMGSTHDIANTTSTPAFPYSYGYGIQGLFGDIMSYLSPKVPYFSNPNLIACAGRPCGTATADAVQTFNNTAPLVASASDASARLSGIYWDPNASGTGWTVDARGDRIIVSSFVYSAQGNPVWSTGLGTPCATDPKSFCVALDEYQNGQTITGAFRGASTKRGKVADATLTFSDGYPASLTLKMGDITKQLQRFIFGGLSTSPISPGPFLPGTYWNSSSPGTGMFVERQGDVTVATYFYFLPDGSPPWSTVGGKNWATGTNGSFQVQRLNFATSENGQTLFGPYRPPSVRNASEAGVYLGLGSFFTSVTIWNGEGIRQNEAWSRFQF